jgi:hypothetical protein
VLTLNRWIIAVAASLLCGLMPVVAARAAPNDPPPIVVDTGYYGFGIRTQVTDPGSPGSRSDGNGAVPVVLSGRGVTCSYQFDGSNYSGGWPQEIINGPTPGVDGAWYYRSCSNGSFDLVWVPNRAANAVAAPRVTPDQLAVQAAKYLPLPAPVVHHNPDRGAGGRPETVVGVQTWLWVSPGSYRTLRQTTAAGGVSATVTATPVSTSWRTGSHDAPSVECAGPGVAYDTSRDPAAQHTYCSTTYARSSASQPQTGPDPNDRFFFGSVTTTWRVTWTGTGGAAGSLPPLRRTTSFQLAVAELQAVNDI